MVNYVLDFISLANLWTLFPNSSDVEFLEKYSLSNWSRVDKNQRHKDENFLIALNNITTQYCCQDKSNTIILPIVQVENKYKS